MKIKGFLAVIVLSAAVIVILWQVKTVGNEEQGLAKQIEVFDKAKTQTTEMNLKTLQREILTYMASHGRTPDNLQQLPPTTQLMIQNADAWGTPIQYKRISSDNFDLISAGNDKKFDTADDIIVKY